MRARALKDERMHQKPSVLEVLSHPPAARRLAGVVNTNSVVRPPIEELAIIHTLYPDARGQRTLRTAATQDSMAGVVNTDSTVRPTITEQGPTAAARTPTTRPGGGNDSLRLSIVLGSLLLLRT